MKRRRRGIRLAFFGLLLGALFGAAVKTGESYVASELTELLQEQAEKACDCTLSLDSIDVSFLTLSAIGKNAVLRLKGEPGLRVENLSLEFDPFSEISEKRVLLTKLLLDGAVVKDLGPEGATFQFIDKLASKPKKGGTKPLLKVRLLGLELRNARLRHDFESLKLFGRKAALQYERLPNGEIRLTPRVTQLVLERDSQNRTELGGLSGSLLLHPNGITIEELGIEKPGAFAAVTGGLTQPGLEFQESGMNVEASASAFDLPEWLQLSLTGSGPVIGRLEKPLISAELALQEGSENAVVIPGTQEAIEISDLKGLLEVSPGSPLILRDLAIQSPRGSLEAAEPLSFGEDGLKGSIAFTLAGLSFEQISVHGVRGALTVGPDGVTAKTAVEGLQIAQFLIPDLALNGEYLFPSATLSVRHGPSSVGEFALESTIRFTPNGPELEPSTLSLNELSPLSFTKGGFPELMKPLRLTGSLEASGPLQLDQISVKGAFEVNPPGFIRREPFTISTTLSEGVLTGKAALSDESVAASFKVPLLDGAERSLLELQLASFNGAVLGIDNQCSQVSLQSRYSFLRNEWLKGDGSFEISSLTLGCPPYSTRLQEPVDGIIQKGVVQIPEVHLASENTDLELRGSVALDGQLDLSASGDIWLRTLLPLFPQIDNLEGVLEPTVTVRGNLGSPEITGEAALRDGVVSHESAGVSIRESEGTLTFQGGRFQTEAITGMFNSGRFSLSGSYSLLHPELSQLSAELDRVVFNPADNLSFVLSSELELQSTELGIPQLRGTIFVDQGEFQRELDLRKFLLELPSLLISTRETVEQQSTRMPEIELDLKIRAARNVFVVTSLFGVEVSGQLAVAGTIQEPLIDGALEALNGWVGFRETRFEITSGRLQFEPGKSTPLLFLAGETYVPTRTGDTALVLLEVEGPLSNPRVSLISDRGDSEQEILALLSSRSNFSSIFTRSTDAGALELRESAQNRERTLVERLLRRAVRIDTLSFEPKYNPRRGQLEPALIAEKKLLPRLILLGESFLSNAELGSIVTLQYSLTKKLFLLGTLDTLNAEEQNAVGIDLKYLVIDGRKPVVSFQFEGNESYSELAILSALRLSQQSRIPPDSTEKLAGDIQRFYQEKGFLDAAAQVRCPQASQYCESVQIALKEGPLYRIQEADLIGDDVPKEVLSRIDLSALEGKRASKSELEGLRQRFVNAFRSEGYIQAAVNTKLNEREQDGLALLSIEVDSGSPITFVFRGNTRFSDRELLETINLFTREQPFGNNTIRILVNNIERKYRENGYLFATINHQVISSDAEERTTYLIEITEERPVPARDLVLTGLEEPLQGELQSTLRSRYGEETTNRIFSPRFAVEEKISDNTLFLDEALHEIGYPDARVDYRLLPDEGGDFVDIEYSVSLGERKYAQQMVIHTEQAGLTLPKPPTAPYSIPRANRYFQQLQSELEAQGYLNSELWSEFIGNSLVIHLEVGRPALIEEIRIEGLQQISISTVLEQLPFTEGERYSLSQLQEARRSLVRLGLFSRVEIQAASVENDDQIITILVEERPLRTLSLGGGLNSEFGVHLFGEALEKGLFRDGKTLALRFDTYWDESIEEVSRGLASLRYTNPDLFENGFIHSEEIQFQRVDLSTLEFDMDRLGLASLLSRRLGSSWAVSFGHTVFQEDLDNVTPGAILGPEDSGVVELSFLSGTLGYDDRDDPLTPREGFASSLEWKLASDAIGSDANFGGVQGRAAYVFPFSIGEHRFGLANNVRAGSQWTFGETNVVPISQRYYLGGRTTVRGFRENSLGPRAEDGAVLGGDLLAQTNTELRYYPEPLLSLHLFLDTGSLTLRDVGFELDEWRASAGIGFRYLSPIGPIGFDLGRPLDERSGEPSIRLHFSVGSLF